MNENKFRQIDAKKCVKCFEEQKTDLSCGYHSWRNECLKKICQICQFFNFSVYCGGYNLSISTTAITRSHKDVQEIVSAKFNWRVFAVFQKATEFTASQVNVSTVANFSRLDTYLFSPSNRRSHRAEKRSKDSRIQSEITIPRTPVSDTQRKSPKSASVRFIRRKFSLNNSFH